MIDIWLIFNLLLPFIEQWSLWFLFPKNDTPPVPYFFSCWLFDSLRSESRSQQEKKAPLLIVLHFFAEYLPPKFSFHFRFRPLLGMKSTILFCKFWNNFSRNLGIGFLLFSCHSRFFFIPSYSQIARMEPSIPFLEFIGVIFAHPWGVSTLHSMWEEADVDCESGTTTIARWITMDALSKLARQIEKKRENITFYLRHNFSLPLLGGC